MLCMGGGGVAGCTIEGWEQGDGDFFTKKNLVAKTNEMLFSHLIF